MFVWSNSLWCSFLPLSAGYRFQYLCMRVMRLLQCRVSFSIPTLIRSVPLRYGLLPFLSGIVFDTYVSVWQAFMEGSLFTLGIVFDTYDNEWQSLPLVAEWQSMTIVRLRSLNDKPTSYYLMPLSSRRLRCHSAPIQGEARMLFNTWLHCQVLFSIPAVKW